MSRHATRLACRALLLALAVTTAGSLQAQLNIALRTNRKHYLRYEPIEVSVVLRNYSGNTLIFGSPDGADAGSLRFTVERTAGPEIRPLDPRFNPVADLILGAGESRELRMNLNEFFDLRPEGSYSITATIGHRRLPNDYRSQPVSIDVREGVPVITRDLGLPQTEPGALIKAVTASLLLFHDGEEWLYCLRAENAEAVLGTVRLGRQISGSQPQMDADAASDVHVLVQLQSRVVLHAVYGLSEQGLRLRQRRWYRPDAFGPRLTRNAGFLQVVGGVPIPENALQPSLRNAVDPAATLPGGPAATPTPTPGAPRAPGTPPAGPAAPAAETPRGRDAAGAGKDP
ncbi:MAG: hypothetical protein GX595_12355 [Lentisphaerae bacterium]|nr:hypothetical protein [Lentisphaerota bacterium]